jgi:perosamine synthetase
MIPRYKPNIRVSDLVSHLYSPKVTIAAVEQTFAKKVNCKFALILPYGRSAYYFLLKAYNYTGQEVIMPAYNCSSLARPVIETGNTPVFVDASPEGYNINLSLIDGKITDRTKLILFSEIWGEAINTKAIDQFKGKGILLVGDYSLSLLNYINNTEHKPRLFDATFFSFGSGKEISAFGGGIIITDDEVLYNKVKEVRNATCIAANFVRNLTVTTKILASVIVYSSLFYKSIFYLAERTTFLNRFKNKDDTSIKLPNDFFILPSKLQLFLISIKLNCLDEFIADRERVLAAYYIALSNAGITSFYPYKLASSLALKCDENEIKKIQKKLFANNIHTTTVYKRSLPDITACDTELYPNAQKYTKSITMLPVFYGITEKQIKKVARILGVFM